MPYPFLFPLGTLVATRGAVESASPSEMELAIRRHACGDWGDVCDEDRSSNDRALVEGTRLFSVYNTPGGTEFWIITEWDRSVTTVLLPEEC